jgi:hypothetical protein
MFRTDSTTKKHEFPLIVRSDGFRHVTSSGANTSQELLFLEKREEGMTSSSSKNDGLQLLWMVPTVFLTWFQLFFNVAMICFVAYCAVQFVLVLMVDLEKHIQEKSHLILSDIVACSREYIKNGCSSGNIPPAMEPMCDAWKVCMNQDTNNIMKTKETALILAEILNHFFENLTDRTIYCATGLFIGSIILVNAVLSWSLKR